MTMSRREIDLEQDIDTYLKDDALYEDWPEAGDTMRDCIKMAHALKALWAREKLLDAVVETECGECSADFCYNCDTNDALAALKAHDSEPGGDDDE